MFLILGNPLKWNASSEIWPLASTQTDFFFFFFPFQCADVHMVSDSEGDDFEDAPEFGVDDSEMFGLGSSTCRKSPMSMWSRHWEQQFKLQWDATFIHFFPQCQKIVRMKPMPYCTLLPNFLQGEKKLDVSCFGLGRKATLLSPAVVLLCVLQIWRDSPHVLHWVFGGSLPRSLLWQSQRCE